MLGVLEHPGTDTIQVPGTVLLIAKPLDSEPQRKGNIILSPQPDKDPGDPLNWPKWRRDVDLLSLGWHCLVGGGMTPALAAGFYDVAKDFGVTIPKVALTTGLYMLGLGIGCLVVSPTAIIFGKRPVYLFGGALFLAASAWCAASQSYASLVAGRIIMGIGVAPCEALPTATISEIFFLHEKAYRVGVYTLLLLGGKNLVPLVSAAIIQELSWRWVFWIVAIIVGFNLVLLFLFVPETWWDRTLPKPSDEHLSVDAGATGKEEIEIPTPRLAKQFEQGLKIYNGILRRESWIKACIRPILLLSYPAVLWSTVVYSFSIGWLIVLSETVAHIYQAQPYNFSRLGTGLVYISPFIGGILGTAVAGKVSDLIVQAMSRRNKGIYEPEFRLVMGIPVAIATAIGLMGFGWSAAERDNWMIPTFFFGMISFGCSLGSTTAITFCVDSYRQYATESLVALNFSKNVFHGLIFSLFFNHWLERDGSKRVFLVLGGLHLACLAFTIPLYIFGKRLRVWTSKQ